MQINANSYVDAIIYVTGAGVRDSEFHILFFHIDFFILIRKAAFVNSGPDQITDIPTPRYLIMTYSRLRKRPTVWQSGEQHQPPKIHIEIKIYTLTFSRSLFWSDGPGLISPTDSAIKPSQSLLFHFRSLISRQKKSHRRRAGFCLQANYFLRYRPTLDRSRPWKRMLIF